MYKNLALLIGVIVLTGQEGFCQNLIDVIQNDAKTIKQNQIYVSRSNPEHLQIRPIVKYATGPTVKYVPVQVPGYPSVTPQIPGYPSIHQYPAIHQVPVQIPAYASAIPHGSYRAPPVLFYQKKRSAQKFFQSPVIFPNGYNQQFLQYQFPHLNQRTTVLYPVNYNRPAPVVPNQNNVPRYTLVKYVDNKTVTKK